MYLRLILEDESRWRNKGQLFTRKSFFIVILISQVLISHVKIPNYKTIFCHYLSLIRVFNEIPLLWYTHNLLSSSL